MKTILIATDFSSSSRNASLYGVALAELLEAKVILVSAYEIPVPFPSLNVSISPYGVMKDIEQKLTDEVKLITKGTRILFETICDVGEAEKVINSIANEKKVDFIIIGMKGKGKDFKKVFGSTTTSLSKSTDVPLLVVPEEATFSTPKTILYASDIPLDTNIGHIDQLKSITELFGSKLYVVKIVKDKSEELFEKSNSLHKLRKELQILDTSFEYPVGKNITDALNEFIEEHSVDILVMMPHKHQWLERIFKKSETKDMIFHTHIPLFVLPELSSRIKTSDTLKAVVASV